jgi:hypothetical protein
MYTIIRTYTSYDGTRLVIYRDNKGYENTVPLYIYRKMIRKKV